jgi:FkbM family methyltransferase
MTVIDAGANIGYFTLIAARLVGPHGHVYAFEPVPTTAELLRKNIEINGYSDRVTVIQKALTDNASMVRIYLDDLALGISSIMANKQSNNYVDVESISLDGFFREKSWPQIHLVKMDIEGAEKLALNGMKALCRRNPRLSLIIEVNLRFNVNELFDALLACGFSRFYLLEDHSRLINIPQDIPQIISVSQGILVNLLCKKAG